MTIQSYSFHSQKTSVDGKLWPVDRYGALSPNSRLLSDNYVFSRT